MSLELVIAVSLTIGISALCSTLEAMILSITSAELENLKIASPRKGNLLAKFRNELEETSSAILSLNTIANSPLVLPWLEGLQRNPSVVMEIICLFSRSA